MNAGDRISDYIVERSLGEGGMGTVYLARHTVLDQQVAIKILDPEVARKSGVRERFIQEANIQAKLMHPNIVRVLTATNNEGGSPALIMDYVGGKSLAEVLELRGALPVADAMKIMEQMLSAVGYAHTQGVIHRDLKPSNVMVMASGETKVTDFGIAKLLGSTRKTSNGVVLGTPHYMSPEQIRRPETVDSRSDIYSLGCVFYELLSGRPPFGEKDASGIEPDFEIKNAHVYEDAPTLKDLNMDVPDWLSILVMTMLAKSPDERPSSCEMVLEKLQLQRTQITEPLKKPVPPRPKADNRFKKAALIAACFILTVGFLYFNYQKNPSDRQAANLVATPTPIPGQTSEAIAQQAKQLEQKITAGNPRKLASCPENPYERFDNCWGRKVEQDQEYEGEWLNDSKTGYGIVRHSNGARYVGEVTDGKSNGLGVLYFTNTDSKGRIRYEGLQRYDNWEKGKLFFNDGNFENFINHGKTSLDPIENNLAEPISPRQKEVADTTAKQAVKLSIKIVEGNPRKLAPCPKNQNERFDNCWGKKVELDQEYEGEWLNDSKTGFGIVKHSNGAKYVGEFTEGKSNGLGVLYFPNTDPKGRYSYEGLQENDKKIKGKLLFIDGNFEFVFKVRKPSSYGQN